MIVCVNAKAKIMKVLTEKKTWKNKNTQAEEIHERTLVNVVDEDSGDFGVLCFYDLAPLALAKFEVKKPLPPLVVTAIETENGVQMIRCNIG